MNSPLFSWYRLALISVAAVLTTPAVRALVIYGGNTGHTTNPGFGLPWDNVGAGGVYLGAFDRGNWVITANHVGSSGITLNGTYYSSVPGSAHEIGSTDLLLYRIDGAPALENLNFSSNTPVPGGNVVMIGNGGGVKSWGTNTVDQYAYYHLVTGGPQTVGLITTYSPITGESQGQGGDSGGGLFYQMLDGSWLLSGILSGVGTSNGTDFTASVAVAFYYGDIVNLVGNPIPEPATYALGLSATVPALAIWRRRRTDVFGTDDVGDHQ